jgi:hypothetical protein
VVLEYYHSTKAGRDGYEDWSVVRGSICDSEPYADVSSIHRRHRMLCRTFLVPEHHQQGKSTSSESFEHPRNKSTKLRLGHEFYIRQNTKFPLSTSPVIFHVMASTTSPTGATKEPQPSRDSTSHNTSEKR